MIKGLRNVALVSVLLCSVASADCISVTGPIRDENGRFMGKIESVSDSRLAARDCHGRLVGRYDVNTNQTRDRNGKLVGTGYLLPRLIPECN